MKIRPLLLFSVILLVALVIALNFLSCTHQQREVSSTLPAAPVPVEMAHFDHVFVVVEENENYDEVIGNTKDMPYLNSLAEKYGVATNYYANTHPSINNYFYLTAGHAGTRSPWVHGLTDLFPGEVAGDNIASILSGNGKTWKAYAESIPQAGYLGSDRIPYVKRHNPFAYFENVRQGKVVSGQRLPADNIVPFDAFVSDLKNNSLPDYSFIVPNIYNDGHSDPKTGRGAACGDHHALQNVDGWLKTNIDPLIQSDGFQRSGLLIILFDEACEEGPKADWRYDPGRPGLRGGGHIPALIISSRTPPGTKVNGLYHHESVLRLSLRALGIEQFPGLAKQAPDIDGFFKSQPKSVSIP